MGPSKWPATFLQHQVWSHQKWIKLIWPPKIGGETFEFDSHQKTGNFMTLEKNPSENRWPLFSVIILSTLKWKTWRKGFVGSYRKTFESLTISTKKNVCHAAKIQSSWLFSKHLSYWMHFLVDFQHQGQEKYENNSLIWPLTIWVQPDVSLEHRTKKQRNQIYLEPETSINENR